MWTNEVIKDIISVNIDTKCVIKYDLIAKLTSLSRQNIHMARIEAGLSLHLNRCSEDVSAAFN
jgi:hypothetical protein